MFEKGGFRNRRACGLLKSTAWCEFNVAPENVNVNSKPVGATVRYSLTFPDTNQKIVDNPFQKPSRNCLTYHPSFPIRDLRQWPDRKFIQPVWTANSICHMIEGQASDPDGTGAIQKLDNLSNRKTAVAIFRAALASVDPCRLVQKHIPDVLDAYRRGNGQRLMLAAFGKAAFAMTRALAESPAGELITRGTVITKYGHVPGTLPDPIAVYEAGHPLPDAAGVAATGRLMAMLENPDPQTLLVCLISGGGSALLVAPADGLTLAEKQATTQCLLAAGADIGELNAVRKHISGIKGGQLAALARPARVLSLILSDVIGDPLHVIASGPTAPDNTTYADALAVIGKYGLEERIPNSVYQRLIQGREGTVPETPAKDDPVFADVANLIIGSNKLAIEAAAAKATAAGFETVVLTTELRGEAREAARWLAQQALAFQNQQPAGKKLCLVSGGETTVTVTGTGKGGRNTELALAFAEEIDGRPGITLLSAGTDGTDGPTDAAGAVVDGQTIARANARGLSSDAFLSRNDSYTFFKKTDELLITGSTGTNVMDIQVVLLT